MRVKLERGIRCIVMLGLICSMPQVALAEAIIGQTDYDDNASTIVSCEQISTDLPSCSEDDVWNAEESSSYCPDEPTFEENTPNFSEAMDRREPDPVSMNGGHNPGFYTSDCKAACEILYKRPSDRATCQLMCIRHKWVNKHCNSMQEWVRHVCHNDKQFCKIAEAMALYMCPNGKPRPPRDYPFPLQCKLNRNDIKEYVRVPCQVTNAVGTAVICYGVYKVARGVAGLCVAGPAGAAIGILCP